jgi:hypothetical protein
MKALLPVLAAISLYVTGDAIAQSGYTYDWQSGNSYNWDTDDFGNTHVYGMNPNTGSTWNTTIDPQGNMQGFDAQMNPWSYDSGTGTYFNFGTGRMCIGQRPIRSCF